MLNPNSSNRTKQPTFAVGRRSSWRTASLLHCNRVFRLCLFSQYQNGVRITRPQNPFARQTASGRPSSACTLHSI